LLLITVSHANGIYSYEVQLCYVIYYLWKLGTNWTRIKANVLV